MNIKEQLTLYPELTEEERATVDAYVDAHPQWQAALDEAKRWEQLLADVRLLGQDPTSDEALAYYVVTRRLQSGRAPEALADLVRRMDERIQNDPALGSRVREMDLRLQEVEQGSPASEQFERLLERRRGNSHTEAGVTSIQSAPGRPAPRRTRSPVWRVAVALILTACLYVVLYVAGDLARPTHERLADFTNEELSLEGYENVRGNGSDPAGVPGSLYLEALTQLRDAKTSNVGLFPTFDEARLDSAVALLQDVIRAEPAESFLAGEAEYLLGKAELARGNVDAARQALSRVVTSSGRNAPEARRILAELDA